MLERATHCPSGRYPELKSPQLLGAHVFCATQANQAEHKVYYAACLNLPCQLIQSTDDLFLPFFLQR